MKIIINQRNEDELFKPTEIGLFNHYFKSEFISSIRIVDEAFDGDMLERILKDSGFDRRNEKINFEYESGPKDDVVIFIHDERKIMIMSFFQENEDFSGVEVSSLIFYYPCSNDVNSDQKKFILDLIGEKTILSRKKQDESAAYINIISQNGSGLYTKQFIIDPKKVNIDHIDLHYGEGFSKFHDRMLEKLEKMNKGLVLFHGDPGNGKTQYLRYLISKLSKIDKSVLYVPPSFSSHLTEPHMIEYISNWVSSEDNDCILLIEDAEPLLESRTSDGRSTGISNLLNMTDGILNDILGVTVIATFNTSISNIDPALLRPGRLIARKQFKPLTFSDGEKLSKALGVKNPLLESDYPATLAKFYSFKNEGEILVHTLEEDRRRIGF